MPNNRKTRARHLISYRLALVLISLSFAFLVEAGSRSAMAQVLYGRLVGEVTDSSGAVVPGAAVKATRVDTNENFTGATNSAGHYVLDDLPPGTYELTITAKGFTAFHASSFPLVMNTTGRVDAVLQPGAVTTEVTVSAQAQGVTLETEKADVHADITASQFVDLPQPTRTYEGLIGTMPGVPPPSASSGGTNDPAKSMTMWVNGTNYEGTDVRIEGVSDVDTWVQFFSNLVPSQEAIDTVNVVSSTPDVDQGLASGATINVQIKSGTNKFHGEVYEFNNNNGMKARPFFIAANQRKPKSIENDFGGTMGGPIIKNKLFFFASYEGDYTRSDNAAYYTVPTAAMEQGNFSAISTIIYQPATANGTGTDKVPFANNVIPTASLSPITQKLLVPTPNTSVNGVYTSNFYYAAGYKYNLQKWTAKIDWDALSKLRITGRFDYEPYYGFNGQPFGDTLGGGGVYIQFGHIMGFTGSAIYTVSPTFVITAAVGFTKADQLINPVDGNQKYTNQVLGIPNTNLSSLPAGGGLANFSASGYTTINSGYNYLDYADPSYNYTANFTKTHGTHAVKWGFNIRRPITDHIETGPDGFTFSGGVTALNGGTAPNQFNGYADFLLGLPSSWATNELNPTFGGTFNRMNTINYSMFVGDKWDVTKKFTVSYGTGWEYWPVEDHKGHGLEFYDVSTNTYEVCGWQDIPRNCDAHTSPKLFAPRLGFAYRLAPTTVFRAGYSIANEQASEARDTLNDPPELLRQSQSQVNPYVPVGTLPVGPPAPTPINLSTGIIPESLSSVRSWQTIPRTFERGYVQSFNGTLQKGFGPWSAQLAYIGTHTIHGHSRTVINYGQVGGGTASMPLFILNGDSTTEAEILPDGYSHYNALQASLDRRFSGGFQMNANYTYSKWIGEPGAQSSDGNVLIPIPQYRYLDRSYMPNDLTHVFHFTGIAQSPFGTGKRWMQNSGVGSAILGKWQLNGVLVGRSGYPFSVSASGSTLNAPGSSQRANQVKTTVAYPKSLTEWFDPYAFQPVTTAAFGTAGFYTMRGPRAWNVDMSLLRNFKLTERFSLQFRFEALNTLNTPHFSTPGASVGSVTYATSGGVPNYSQITALNGFDTITSTTTLSRLTDERYLRVGAKIIW